MMRIPFREINLNTLPVTGPAGTISKAVSSTTESAVSKGTNTKPHIIFLGNNWNQTTPVAEQNKKLPVLSRRNVFNVGRSSQNAPDPDLIRARETISGVVQNCPFIDSTISTKTKTNVSIISRGTEEKEKPTDVLKESSVINQKVELPTPVVSGSPIKPTCVYDDELSDDFEPKKRHEKKCSKSVSKPHTATSSSTPSVSEVMKILPGDHDYRIEINSPSSSNDKCVNFIATLKVDIFSAMQAEKWKTAFEKSSFSDYRVMKTFGNLDTSKRVLFKKKYRCHHNTLAEKSGSKVPREKHTACPAELTITVRNSEMKWSSDDLLKTHPTQILIKYLHNHYIDPLAGDILRHRRPAPEVVEKFTTLFTNTRVYHSPASAMDVYLADMDLDLATQVGDGAVVPTMAWVQKLFRKLTRDKCGDQYGPGMMEALKKYVDEYNEECGDICAKIGVTPDGLNHFISVCSPMMKRIHTHHKATGEIMFIDSTGSMDTNNARVFAILTPSVACGLPIGLLITFSENQNVVTAALQNYKEILPKDAFYGKGPSEGPKIVLSDDSSAERNSVRDCFPGAILLLCIFHVLQAMWRYVWTSEHGVKFEHRAEIYFMFRQILYATTEEEFNALYDEALQNDLLKSYTIVHDHIEGLRSRAPEWALCFRQDLLLRGHNTNNYCEAMMRILKDKIFDRVRAFNTVQLTDFLVTRLDAYYARKIAFLINNRVEGFSRSRYRIKPEKLVPLSASKLEQYDHLYTVINKEKNTEYIVDADLEVCSCPVGMGGAPCKHQCIVAKTFKLTHHQFLPTSDSNIKAIFYYIMTGKTEVPAGLFKLLKGGPDNGGVIDVNNIPEFQQRSNTSDDNCNDQPCPDDQALEILPEGNMGESLHPDLEFSLVEMAKDLAKRCSTKPCMSEPVDKFLKTYWSMVKTGNYESTLASALATFGKDVTAIKPLRATQRHPHSGGTMGVQTTAPGRRKVYCGGRKTQVGGRPPLSLAVAASQADHGYSQVVKRKTTSGKNEESWAQPPTKKAKVPHSLVKVVDARVRLPK